MAQIDPPPPDSPKYCPAPDLLRALVSTYETATAAAEDLGVSKSELSHWIACTQRPGALKRSQIALRTLGRGIAIPESAWLTKAERARATREG